MWSTLGREQNWLDLYMGDLNTGDFEEHWKQVVWSCVFQMEEDDDTKRQ